MHVPPGHPGPQLCNCFIWSAAVCSGHSGEETSRAITWSPPGDKLDQVAAEDAGQTWQTFSKCIVKVSWGRLTEAPVREIFNSHLRQNFKSIPRNIRENWVGKGGRTVLLHWVCKEQHFASSTLYENIKKLNILNRDRIKAPTTKGWFRITWRFNASKVERVSFSQI